MEYMTPADVEASLPPADAPLHVFNAAMARIAAREELTRPPATVRPVPPNADVATFYGNDPADYPASRYDVPAGPVTGTATDPHGPECTTRPYDNCAAPMFGGLLPLDKPPADPIRSTCRSCGRGIRWSVTAVAWLAPGASRPANIEHCEFGRARLHSPAHL